MLSGVIKNIPQVGKNAKVAKVKGGSFSNVIKSWQHKSDAK